jgi:hypothetical protein
MYFGRIGGLRIGCKESVNQTEGIDRRSSSIFKLMLLNGIKRQLDDIVKEHFKEAV